MKSSPVPAIIAFLVLLTEVASAALIFEDQFTVPPNTVGSLPTGWTAGGTGSNNDFVAAPNLTYSGLAAGSAGSWLNDGSANQNYYRNYSGSALAANATVFYSFLFNVSDLGTLSTGGSTSAIVALATNATVAMGSGAVSSFGIRKDSTDSTKFNLSVDGEFRGPGSSSSQIVGLGSWAATGGTQFNLNQTYLLVGSYTNTASSTSRFWIDPISLGGAAPTPTLTDVSPTARAVQSLITRSIANTVGLGSASFTYDAFRVGDSFADVTPVPEPTTVALAGIGLAFVLWRRRRLDAPFF